MHLRKSLIIIATFLALTAALAQTVKWTARFDTPAHADFRGGFVALDANGNAYVMGQTTAFGTGWDFCTIKYDTNGNQVWVRCYDGPAHGNDQVTGLAVDAGGNVYVTGGSLGSAGYDDYCTVKYDTNGNQLWVQRFGGPGYGNDDARAIAVDANGNAYVTGECWTADADYYTIKYDTNGNLVWVRRYDGPGHSSDSACAIALDASGHAYVTGYSVGFGTGYDYCTIKYDADGRQVWLQRYDTAAQWQDYARAIAVDGNGNAYVTGYSSYTGHGGDYLTIKYDTNGTQRWTETYPAQADENPNFITVDGSGNAYVTGDCVGASGCDYLTIKYDTNDGHQLWSQRYDGTAHGYDRSQAVAVDALGNAYVTGYSVGSGAGYDYCTIKYGTNGDPLWEQRYDSAWHGYDMAAGIAVDRSGNAYVTGRSQSASGDSDGVTIMYARPSATVSGNVELYTYVGGPGIVGTLEYRLPGTTQPIWSSQITLDANGNYSDETAPIGTFDLACKFPNWLRQVVPGVTIGPSGATAGFLLMNGDGNADNRVSLTDLGMVFGNFGATGTPPMDGDLNWDGEVGLTDLGIVLLNFGKQGDP